MPYPLESQVSLTRQFTRATAWRSRHSLKDDDELELDQMARAANNRRARLISQIVFPSREFSSYFHGNLRRSKHPQMVTSHARPRPTPQRRTFQTYPSMMQQSLRWNPYVETSSIVQTDDHYSKPSTYNCQCKACTSKKCPSNAMSPLTYIATFCNQCTMTPQVNDVSCGICKGVTPPPRMSEASVSVKNNRSLLIEDLCTYESRCAAIPPPILKPSQCESAGECLTRRRVKSRVSHEPVRDVDQDSSSEKCSRTPKKNRSDISCKMKSNPPSDDEEFAKQSVSRKPLYNEGISDTVANHLSHCPRDASNYRGKGRCWPEPDNIIPYSHTGPSKYHHRCKEQPPVRYRGCQDELGHFASCPFKQGQHGGCARHPAPPRPCSPPRKMLASEPDIDSYVERRHKCDRYSKCCDESHY